jgi:hypothetical protein
MACEVPVIATNVGGVPEVVEHGVDGFLVEPGDVKEAARYAIEILSRPDRGRAMGKTARLNAKKKFCANDVIPPTKLLQAHPRRILTEARLRSDERRKVGCDPYTLPVIWARQTHR